MTDKSKLQGDIQTLLREYVDREINEELFKEIKSDLMSYFNIITDGMIDKQRGWIKSHVEQNGKSLNVIPDNLFTFALFTTRERIGIEHGKVFYSQKYEYHWLGGFNFKVVER